ncbi:polymorphic toxin type 24 domain-containing protein [Ralstonia solanacearum]
MSDRTGLCVEDLCIGEAIVLGRIIYQGYRAYRTAETISRIVNAVAAENSSNADSDEESGRNCTPTSNSGFPDRDLPRDKNGIPVPEPDAEGPHTQLGTKEGRNGKYDQAREFDENGRPVRDIDFTDHGRPNNHPNPHQHWYRPNPTGGTPQRGPTEPLS